MLYLITNWIVLLELYCPSCLCLYNMRVDCLYSTKNCHGMGKTKKKVNNVHVSLDLHDDSEHDIEVQVQLYSTLTSHQRTILKLLDMN